MELQTLSRQQLLLNLWLAQQGKDLILLKYLVVLTLPEVLEQLEEILYRIPNKFNNSNPPNSE